MYSLLSVHDLTKLFIHEVVQKGDLLVDATVGNGHDTLFLLKLAQDLDCRLIGFDIQQDAIEKAKEKIGACGSVEWIVDSHEKFDVYPQIREVGLFVYNLGYLPTKNKTITTMAESTLNSVEKALKYVRVGGGLAITCYSGHSEGKKEILALEELTQRLDSRVFAVSCTQWVNRKECPRVILIKKMRNL
jgi:hypothetical protein